MFLYGKWEHASPGLSYSVAAHTEKNTFFMAPPERARLYVSSWRQLKPFEISLQKRFPWLKQHYPFQRRYYSPIYEWKGMDK